MIDPLLAEALENVERDVSYLMALHESSGIPSNLEERVAELEKQRPPQPSPKDAFQDLRGMILHLERKLYEHIDKKKKVYKKYIS